jgi:hypothetical protein
LIGTSWYTLSVGPTGYMTAWAESGVRAAQLRVMQHIKSLAEAAQ